MIEKDHQSLEKLIWMIWMRKMVIIPFYMAFESHPWHTLRVLTIKIRTEDENLYRNMLKIAVTGWWRAAFNSLIFGNLTKRKLKVL